MEYKPIEVKYHHVISGRSQGGQITPSATLEVMVDGDLIRVSGEGRGPLHAIFNAINELQIYDGSKPYLMSFQLNAEKQGADSSGTAVSRVVFGKKIYEGIGRSEDVVEAAMLSYVDAINQRLMESRAQK